MSERTKSVEEITRENDSLRTRLAEVTDVLTAIRHGEVDALVVEGVDGEQVFTLEGADHPYRTFVETMNEGAVTLTLDGTIVYCNQQFANLTGMLLEQTFGITFLDFLAAPDRQHFMALWRQGDEASVRAELSLEHIEGTTVPVRLSARRLPKNCGDYWCFVITDLRGQKLQEALRESEERLRTFASKLEQRVEARTSELVASQKHLRALANELTRTEQHERKPIATELHDYLAQLLALAIMKLSQFKRKPQPDRLTPDWPTEVHELLSEALNYTRTLVTDLCPPMLHESGLPSALKWLATQMQRHQLTVTLRMPDEDYPKLPDDQALLVFQSIRELLINASKHSGVGEATVLLGRRDGELRIDVCDKGRGFNVCTKAVGVKDDSFGLFSIRERMQALGGSLELESADGKGTRATLVLPLGVAEAGDCASHVSHSEVFESTISALPDTTSVESGNSEHPTERPPQQRIRVLLVDDHAMVRQGLRSLLDVYPDIQVVGEASNGEEALAGVVTYQPAIVVMDINMPRMNGIHATAFIRNRYPEVITIGLSVQTGGEMQEAMLKAGAAALLTKESAVEQLYQTIQQEVQKARHT